MVLLAVNMLLCGGPFNIKKDVADKNKSAPTCLTRCAKDDETQQCHQRFYARQGDGGGKWCPNKPTLQRWTLFKVRPKS